MENTATNSTQNAFSLTQEGPQGIRYDFNDGCRVYVPAGHWRVIIKDLDTHTVLFAQDVNDGFVQSAKRYYVRFGIEIRKDDKLVFSHEMDLKGQPVRIDMRKGGIGDHLAWFGHVAAFAQKHECDLTVDLRSDIRTLVQDEYPTLKLISEDTPEARYYATYTVLVFYNDDKLNHSPVDYREAGLEGNASSILGLSRISRPARITIGEGGRPIEEPYVVIASQASAQNKYWNNPFGWIKLIQELKARGYRVFCIDRERVTGQGTVWNHIPFGAEDKTGALPLSERARWIQHAEFFIGLSSGLSWLAWCVGTTPVVLISGFTRPENEFATPYRVINWHACNGCSNDIRCILDTSNYLWCPRHEGTPRQFECSRLIAPEQVMDIIKTIPNLLEGTP
ncbi:glycosyl transferase [Gluconobacter thailandicus F149-1 = NBRC 100600]|uniref:Glycosyltransferase n=1 Tax=Gluconobacter thailandicus NBRC 3257 TaxID=1381097 RepID=A0ABQ0J0P1_GLUTH|nr:autotransporter strand-loop-strand O-heptosyltransferase [Gluconobacter thailandicus]KXV54569.1 glycosyltransferase [Gluconobacter thailandicus]GAD28031.1 glycosyltransferase [Gluconobacter thailandicus NBRC 3257]GAN93795.1 glycosyl transferase [Gluconobacter thailandicus F149-1 = NBRC 100600]GBR60064.1 glycosyltransferase [Gluconobacter thailandicus F149-1 = NBRC 100600]GEL88412.1 autotransporter strand-loop-strand O-heptosyltransferase [Gluconobacter thailandicus F149-1 = NBRC 100600]